MTINVIWVTSGESIGFIGLYSLVAWKSNAEKELLTVVTQKSDDKMIMKETIQYKTDVSGWTIHINESLTVTQKATLQNTTFAYLSVCQSETQKEQYLQTNHIISDLFGYHRFIHDDLKYKTDDVSKYDFIYM